ncbi:MAG: DNA repair protein RecO [Gammaproteobacteria bacterium]
MENAYVLHRRRYRETSLIVELLSRERGRIAAVARGALRRKSQLAAVLQPLVPLAIETRGRGELLTLTHAEPLAAATPALGERLYAVFYVNELILRLTAAHDPLGALFETYRATLAALAADTPLEPLLRQFELALLEAVGLGLELSSEAHGRAPLDPAREYLYVVEEGALADPRGRHGCRITGATLLALGGGEILVGEPAREAKRLMRYVINHHLDGRPLASRELFAAARPQKP